MIMKILLGVGALFVAAVIFGAFLCLPTYYLWNWLMPTLFGFKHITIIQSLGIVMLSSLLLRTSASK